MELANALYKIDMLVDDQGRTAEKEAWNFIRAYIAEVQKPAHNNARDAIDECRGCLYDGQCVYPRPCVVNGKSCRSTAPVA